MTQTEKFLQFLKMQAEREIPNTEVLLRIEEDELVITTRCRVPEIGVAVKKRDLQRAIDAKEKSRS